MNTEKTWIPLNRAGRRAEAAIARKNKNKRGGSNFAKPKKRK